MEWLREWILRVSGIIILISICDMIMLEGEMKKYIKPSLGMILVIAIIRPISGDVLSSINIEDSYPNVYANELFEQMSNRQYMDMKNIYEQRLEKEINQRLAERYGVIANTTVVAKEKKRGFGEIQSVTIEVDDGEPLNNERIKNWLGAELGIEQSKIRILPEYGEGG